MWIGHISIHFDGCYERYCYDSKQLDKSNDIISCYRAMVCTSIFQFMICRYIYSADVLCPVTEVSQVVLFV